MYPVLLRLGSFTLLSYTALVGVGLLGGTWIAWTLARRRGLDTVHVLDAAPAAALVGLICARAVYVATNWAYYADHLGESFRLWEGGLAWHGGLGGGLVSVMVYCAVRRVPLPVLLDVMAPGVALLSVCVWLGCFLDQCAWGIETYPGQGLLWVLSMELPDIYGIWVPRVAVQLLGAGWGAIVMAVFLVRLRARLDGLVFPLWLVLYCIGSVGLGFLRGDAVPLLMGWRIDQVTDAGLAAIGAAVLALGLLRRARDTATA